MHADFFGFALRPPFPSIVLEVSDEFLPLRVDRNDRLTFGQGRLHGRVDDAELCIMVGVVTPFARLAVGLQAEIFPLQQFGHHRVAHPVPPLGQFRRETPQALAGPAQRRHRITPRIGLHQGQQVRDQAAVHFHQSLATVIERFSARESLEPTVDRADRNAGRGRHDPGATRTQNLRLRRAPKTTGALIQMRRQGHKTLTKAVGLAHPPHVSEAPDRVDPTTGVESLNS